MQDRAVAGVGLSHALEPTLEAELACGQLRVVLEPAAGA
jgi:hypothetical protein